MASISFSVIGTPAPQGSKRAFSHAKTGKIMMVENSKKCAPWRQAVAYAAMEARHGVTLKGPITFIATYFFKRPKWHFFPVNRNHNGELRPDAPKYVTTTPDMDKVNRATWDALKQSGAIIDDKNICREWAQKLYSNDGQTGAKITVEEI